VTQVDYLIVGGGGGGGSTYGGGGAGGFRTGTGLSVTAGTTYTITVGAGGAHLTVLPLLAGAGVDQTLGESMLVLMAVLVGVVQAHLQRVLETHQPHRLTVVMAHPPHQDKEIMVVLGGTAIH
jgi:hypothetical protein